MPTPEEWTSIEIAGVRWPPGPEAAERTGLHEAEGTVELALADLPDPMRVVLGLDQDPAE